MNKIRNIKSEFMEWVAVWSFLFIAFSGLGESLGLWTIIYYMIAWAFMDYALYLKGEETRTKIWAEEKNKTKRDL